MKKGIALLLAVIFVLSMAACAAQTDAEPENTVSANMEPLAPVESSAAGDVEASETDAAALIEASGTNAQALAQATPQASSTDSVVDETAYATAQEYVGRTVEELYEVIGEPTGGTQYAASCAQDDAEDGMLFYDGFYIWSIRTEEQETVYAVYLDN